MGCRASRGTVRTLPELENFSFAAIQDLPDEFYSKYSLQGKLGRGCYAQVHSARKRTDKATGSVAVKIIALHCPDSETRPSKKACLKACTEINLWSRVGSHRNCVRMHEGFVDDHLCYMVLEKCCCGLIDHIKSFTSPTEKSLQNVFAQMLQGIAHIHSLNIVHRDIKPDNYLVGGKNGRTIKLGDFGLAGYVKDGCKIQGEFGTAPYMCPEMVLNKEADLKADIWSFGVVAYLLLTGKFPYSGKESTQKSMKGAIAKGMPPDCKKLWLTPAANSFLACLLQREPGARASASFALKTAYITRSSKAKLTHCSDLRPMLFTASCTGAFEPADLNKISVVDRFLDDLGAGRAQRNSKALSQHDTEAFIKASPDQLDQLIEAMWPPVRVGGKPQKGHMPSVVSTPIEHSLRNANKLKEAQELLLPGCISIQEDDFSAKSTACESSLPGNFDDLLLEVDSVDGCDTRSTGAIGRLTDV